MFFSFYRETGTVEKEFKIQTRNTNFTFVGGSDADKSIQPSSCVDRHSHVCVCVCVRACARACVSELSFKLRYCISNTKKKKYLHSNFDIRQHPHFF